MTKWNLQTILPIVLIVVVTIFIVRQIAPLKKLILGTP